MVTYRHCNPFMLIEKYDGVSADQASSNVVFVKTVAMGVHLKNMAFTRTVIINIPNYSFDNLDIWANHNKKRN